MVDLNLQFARAIYTKAGHHFADHYQTLAHNVSENLKPELRWKNMAHKSWVSGRQKLREIELESIALLDQERYNLFYAIEWSHQNTEWKLVCLLVDDLATYFNTRSYWLEWVHFAELAVADSDLTGDLKLKAIALNNLSVVYRQLDRLTESIQCCQESAILCKLLDDKYGEGLSFGNLGGTYFAQRNYQAAFESYTNALHFFQKSRELYEQAQCLVGIGIVLARQQKLAKASSYLKSGIKIQRKIADRFGEAQALNNLGVVQKMQNKINEAIDSFQKSLRLKQEVGDQQGIANSLTNLAIAYENSGELMLAIESWEKTITLLREINPSDVERTIRRLARTRAKVKP